MIVAPCFHLGEILEKQGQKSEARNYLKRCLESNPRHRSAAALLEKLTSTKPVENQLFNKLKKLPNPEKLKIFVTGHTGCGKTRLAQKIAHELDINYYDFDSHWIYRQPNEDIYFLKSLGNNFVTDAIPFGVDYSAFKQYYDQHSPNVLVFCSAYSDFRGWIRNILLKDHYVLSNKACQEIDYYYSWVYFHTRTIQQITDMEIPVSFYNNHTDTEMSPEGFQLMVSETSRKIRRLQTKNQPFFKDYLDMLNYDRNYGDVEFINFTGYSNSLSTWERISNLVDWQDKVVLDLGCFHGYFSFKARKKGARKVFGLEKSPTIVDTSKIIGHITEAEGIEFQQWEGGDPTPPGDIALILNMLHHVKNMQETLKNVNAPLAIIEIDKKHMPPVLFHYKVLKEVESHRKGTHQDRIIILGEKKK